MRQIVDEIGQKVGEYESNFTVNFPGKSRKSGGNSRGCDRCRKLILFPLPPLPSTFHSSNFRGKNVQNSRLNARQSCINFSRLICTRSCIQEFIAPRVGWSDHSRVARNLLAHESSRVIVCSRFTTTRLHNVNLSTVTMTCSRGVESKEETEVCM